MKKILALVLALALVSCAIMAMAEDVPVMTKEEYDKVLERDPKNVAALYYRAYVYEKQHKYKFDGRVCQPNGSTNAKYVQTVR